MPKESQTPNVAYLSLDCNFGLADQEELDRWEKQRMERGFSHIDEINMPRYLAWVITNMLDSYVKGCVNCPGWFLEEGFMPRGWPKDDPILNSYHSWKSFLQGISEKIKRACELINANRDTSDPKFWKANGFYCAQPYMTPDAEKLIRDAFADLAKYFFYI